MSKTNQSRIKTLIKRINWYPPYFFSGIKIIEYAEDFTSFKVRLKLTWYNRNLLGTAFGGSLYAMCDPFFMFILMIYLGKEYVVWDKTASIDFVKPGKGTVYAEFKLSPEELKAIKDEVDQMGKKVFEFPCEVRDREGRLVAKLSKGVYVRKKN